MAFVFVNSIFQEIVAPSWVKARRPTTRFPRVLPPWSHHGLRSCTQGDQRLLGLSPSLPSDSGGVVDVYLNVHQSRAVRVQDQRHFVDSLTVPGQIIKQNAGTLALLRWRHRKGVCAGKLHDKIAVRRL